MRFQKKGIKNQHFFNDKDYSDKEASLAAAIDFRDAIKFQFPSDHQTGSIIDGNSTKSIRNKSGVIGVNRTRSCSTKNGIEFGYDIWQSHWPLGNGKSGSKSFSVNRYGEEGAFRKALEAREEGVSLLKREMHPALQPIDDLHQKVWRYMDFTKFVSMLEESALFFSCIDGLDDPFEGSFSIINEELRPLIYKNTNNINNSEITKELRKVVSVSCWHKNDHESAAMWELYSKSEEAVCIQSTYSKLSKQLHNKAEIGVVQYVDYKEEFIPEHDPYLAFLYKRKSFEHEREIRGIIKNPSEAKLSEVGYLHVDLNELIEKIYVSPNSPSWFLDLVTKTTMRYKLIKPVIQSSLSDDPVY